jgi:hypothetical protein
VPARRRPSCIQINGDARAGPDNNNHDDENNDHPNQQVSSFERRETNARSLIDERRRPSGRLSLLGRQLASSGRAEPAASWRRPGGRMGGRPAGERCHISRSSRPIAANLLPGRPGLAASRANELRRRSQPIRAREWEQRHQNKDLAGAESWSASPAPSSHGSSAARCALASTWT